MIAHLRWTGYLNTMVIQSTQSKIWKLGILFLVWDVCLNEKGSSVKIQLLNIFRDNHIVAKSGPTTTDYDKFIH